MYGLLIFPSSSELHNRKDLKVSIPSWVYNGNHIWGLTAMITADFLNICFNASINTDLDLIRTYDDY